MNSTGYAYALFENWHAYDVFKTKFNLNMEGDYAKTTIWTVGNNVDDIIYKLETQVATLNKRFIAEFNSAFYIV